VKRVATRLVCLRTARGRRSRRTDRRRRAGERCTVKIVSPCWRLVVNLYVNERDWLPLRGAAT
jgi:hypothetical protein